MSGTDAILHDVAGLRRIEARLGFEGAADFFEAVADPSEDYELGLAVGSAGDLESVLVSYNPRTRRTAFRGKALAAMEAVGLETGPARALFDRIDDAHGSTVVGLEWARGGGVEATVYVEELTRFFGREGAMSLASELCGAYGQRLDLPESEGEPYILAVDLPGPVFKLYRLHFAPPVALLDRLDIAAPRLAAPGAAAFIEQWHLPSGRLKLYRCYDYAEGKDDPVEAAALYGEPGPWAGALIDGLGTLMQRPVGVTSVSRRFGEPSARSLYWCASGPWTRQQGR